MRPRKVFRDKRRNKAKIWIIIAIVLVTILAAIQCATLFLYNQTFHKRISSEGNMEVCRRTEYVTMNQYRVEFESDMGQKLVGYVYEPITDISMKGVIVVNHGFGGGGHEFYMPDIDFMTKYGYVVFAFDKTGNDESEGKYVKGLPQGVIDLEYALDVVRTHEITKNLPIMLYGHSWGGFSVCAALEKQKDIAAVVSISGFNKSQDVLLSEGKAMYGPIVGVLSPFVIACNVFNYGMDAFMSSEKGLAATDTPVMLIHSKDDQKVLIEDSFNLYKEKLGDKKNLTFIELDGRGHYPMESQQASAYLASREARREQYVKDNPDATDEAVAVAMLDGYDRELAHELDKDLMMQIISFFDSASTVDTDPGYTD